MDLLVQEPLYDPGYLPSEVKTLDVFIHGSTMVLACVVEHGTMVKQCYPLYLGLITMVYSIHSVL